ncbi:diguanylate cyclase [Alginatibacterium sediminis]|uniref:diguanylate cyclase n=1 Tax=Alginatibacterium sediminis TaxID=2164068 RepID=A0A420E5X4_9ALTE|nr:diguanylate cyclase [Alginatibacterium sediminis]RKF13249.1 diguanylate cyclase [Alginatibacterium sediminis]
MKNKILIIEDSSTVSRLQQTIAFQSGYEVDVAMSLREAASLVKNSPQPYFVAIADYVLPDAARGESIDFCIRENIPTIAMTGLLSNAIREHILEREVIDYIPKENIQAFDYLRKLLVQLQKNASIKVLVVDDSIATLNYITTLLERHYFNVFNANNGVEALEMTEQHPDIKLVITDHEMPEMDGVSLTTHLRKNFSNENMGIIGVSSSDNKALSARFIKNGANDYLAKPFCTEEFYCRVLQNITLLEQVETIHRQANTDYLTQLPNRRYFFHVCKNMINKRPSTERMFAIMDIDHFKSVNDRYGHDIGDIVLQHSATLLQRHFGEQCIARFGGEEFVVFFENTSRNEALRVLEGFRVDLQDTAVSVVQATVKVTVSIGFASSHNLGLNELIKIADQRLYTAKEIGRNQIVSSD